MVTPGTRPAPELLSTALVRGAGFPIEQTALPGAGEASACAERVLRLDGELAGLGDLLVGLLGAEPLPRATRKRLGRRLRGGAPVDVDERIESATTRTLLLRWNAAVVERGNACTALAAAADVELAEAESHLRKWLAAPRAEEALWFSSRSAATGMDRYRDGRGSATDRRVALRYLQRLTTKNETTSFFGPHQFADVVDEPAPALAFDPASPSHGA
ncbi:hypothetical protein ACFV4N_43075, partial [Actinosynnema sp. NPDC059797]